MCKLPESLINYVILADSYKNTKCKEMNRVMRLNVVISWGINVFKGSRKSIFFCVMYVKASVFDQRTAS